jgi:hypothetical protein
MFGLTKHVVMFLKRHLSMLLVVVAESWSPYKA